MREQITNVRIYGLDESIRASKYPMSVNPEECTAEITEGVISRGSAPAGSAHDCFLKGIVVQFDLTMSIKMSVEMERYHFIDFVSSQSTMHRITKLDIKESCNDFVVPEIKYILKKLISDYNSLPTPDNYLRVLYNVPTGFCLTARMTTNYLQLKTIYEQRHNHRLPEWRSFCEWITALPMFEKLTKAGAADDE